MPRTSLRGLLTKIKKVAIVGVSGQIGKHITAAIASTDNHTITALTRHESNTKVPDGVIAMKVDYENEESLVEALRGQQFLIISLAVTSPKDTQAKIIKAAAKAGVAWIMPNCYGTNVFDEKLATENLTGPGVLPNITLIEDLGVSSWVAMCCSFWYEFSLSMGPEWYGFDFANRKVTFVDDGTTKINTSTWDQCGRAMKALLSLNVLPEDENDKSTTLSEWQNQPLFVSSFLVSQRDMLDSVNRVLGTTDGDWTIRCEPHEERYQRGMEIMKKGDHLGFGICLYTRTFYPNGGGNYEVAYGLANEQLSLPREDVDEATKRAIVLMEGGFGRVRSA